MEKLEPVFKALPIALLIYGLVLAIGESFEVSMSASSMMLEADTEWQLRMALYVAYLRALEPLFFYGSLSAVVHWLNKRAVRASA